MRKQASERASGRGGVYTVRREREEAESGVSSLRIVRAKETQQPPEDEEVAARLAAGGGHVLGGGGGSARHSLASCMNRKAFGHDSLAWEMVFLHEQVRNFDFTIYDLKFEAVTLL